MPYGWAHAGIKSQVIIIGFGTNTMLAWNKAPAHCIYRFVRLSVIVICRKFRKTQKNEQHNMN